MSASVHNQNSDALCFISFMEGMRIGLQRLPKNTVADAADGGEESYDYL